MIRLALAAQQAATDDGGFVAIVFIMLSLSGFTVYFLPSFIAFIRKVPNAVSVLIINFFLGWTLIGWVVALAMAARSRPPAPLAINQP